MIEFTALNQAQENWTCVAASPNGDVYAGFDIIGEYTSIYKQTNGNGNFVQYSTAFCRPKSICVAPNGDIYVVSYNSEIFKQSRGIGDFVQIAVVQNCYDFICAAPNGDIYVTSNRNNPGVHKQTGGVGSFVHVEQTKHPNGICAAPNGDIYISVGNQDIYRQQSGGNTFIALGQGTLTWTAMASAPNGDIYVVSLENLYKLPAGGEVFQFAQQNIYFSKSAICVSLAGYLYASHTYDEIILPPIVGDIYKSQQISSPGSSSSSSSSSSNISNSSSSKFILRNYSFGTEGRYFGTLELNETKFSKLGLYYGKHYGNGLNKNIEYTNPQEVPGGALADATLMARVLPNQDKFSTFSDVNTLAFVQSYNKTFSLIEESENSVEQKTNLANSTPIKIADRPKWWNPSLDATNPVDSARSEISTYNITSANTYSNDEHTLGVYFSALSADNIITEAYNLALINDHTIDEANTYSEEISARMNEYMEKIIDSGSYDLLRRPWMIGITNEENEITIMAVDEESTVTYNDSSNPYDWDINQLCYALPDALKLSHVMEHGFNADLYTQNYNGSNTVGFLSGNIFRTKSFYTSNFEMETSGHFNGMGSETLGVQRRYYNIDGLREKCWMRYRENRDYDYLVSENINNLAEGVNEPLITRYDFAERIAGLYKYQAFSAHKAPFYSLRIIDSGLNEALDGITYPENDANGFLVGPKLREIAEQQIRALAKKHQPAHTQLWKIIWEGR